jgi:ATP/maltotriose-dependent transcriptional regulator MalT
MLIDGRASFAASAWRKAYTQLSAADRAGPLGPEDLDRLAIAAYLVGSEVACVDARTRSYHEWARRGDVARAARSAFWLAFGHQMNGQRAQCNGWLARARRLLTDGDEDLVEHGYVLSATAVEAIVGGDATTAVSIFGEAQAVAERFGDRDLMALCGLGRGQALVQLGQVAAAVAAFDEVMVVVTTDRVSVIVTGIVYCAVVLECQRLFDLRRASEWTVALGRWSDRQQGMVPYRGQCLVHRSEIMHMRGDWPDALREARLASEWLSGDPAAGMAFYQMAELFRLRGEFDAAEEAYRQASRCGREPQPGLALLRLAQGKVDAASAAIGRVAGEARDTLTRAHVLGAYVEIMLAVPDVSAARAAVDELSAIAADLDAAVLRAVAAHAAGAVCLAEGDGRAALAASREAWTTWQELDSPYGAARARVSIGLACRQLGDEDGAATELDAAGWIFRRLGAEPDLAGVAELAGLPAGRPDSGLTAREREVLALVAAGKTNREIASELQISNHTVRRHLQNVFVKLGVASRAAATAHALRHELI